MRGATIVGVENARAHDADRLLGKESRDERLERAPGQRDVVVDEEDGVRPGGERPRRAAARALAETEILALTTKRAAGRSARTRSSDPSREPLSTNTTRSSRRSAPDAGAVVCAAEPGAQGRNPRAERPRRLLDPTRKGRRVIAGLRLRREREREDLLAP